MSGGVDSSVAAGLLARRGYEVIGLTMQIWQESQTDPRHAGCCSLGAVEDARRVARTLGIPHYVFNFREEFREAVIRDFEDEYARGRTPNPCVQCNGRLKFDLLLHKAEELGCTRMATGHYARIRRFESGYRLMRARGTDKDQSYVLYMLNQHQLAKSWFPLGEMASKAETRSMAAEMGLGVAEKPDSQEICFVSEAGGYREFLRSRRPEAFSEGEIVDRAGRVLARHGGLPDFTIGQRRGIGTGGGDGSPLYVLSMDGDSNRVTVGSERDLYASEVALEEMRWHRDVPEEGLRVEAKIRYNMRPEAARLMAGSTPRLVFERAVRAVTPGQIAVAYVGKTVVAGGVIRGAKCEETVNRPGVSPVAAR